MNRTKMIGAMKRTQPGGFSKNRPNTSQTGTRAINRAADWAVKRLCNKGGLR